MGAPVHQVPGGLGAGAGSAVGPSRVMCGGRDGGEGPCTGGPGGVGGGAGSAQRVPGAGPALHSGSQGAWGQGRVRAPVPHVPGRLGTGPSSVQRHPVGSKLLDLNRDLKNSLKMSYTSSMLQRVAGAVPGHRAPPQPLLPEPVTGEPCGECTEGTEPSWLSVRCLASYRGWGPWWEAKLPLWGRGGGISHGGQVPPIPISCAQGGGGSGATGEADTKSSWQPPTAGQSPPPDRPHLSSGVSKE